MKMGPGSAQPPSRSPQSPPPASVAQRAVPERSPEQVHGASQTRCSSARSAAALSPQGSIGALGYSPPGSAASRRHDARKAKRAVESNAKAIENRIRYFQKEEEQVWRDLEEVRRKAAAIESGRSRALEKKLTERTLQQERDAALQENRQRVAERRSLHAALQGHSAACRESVIKERQLAAQRQRMASVEVLQRMRMEEMEARMRNSERVSAIQREKLEAASRNNEQREMRLARIKREQESEWQAAEVDAIDAESVLGPLEAQEMECLQRLQNSRRISQSVLQELETSLGARSPVAALLRAKQKDLGDLSCAPSAHSASKILFEEDESEPPPEDISLPPRPDSLGGGPLGDERP